MTLAIEQVPGKPGLPETVLNKHPEEWLRLDGVLSVIYIFTLLKKRLLLYVHYMQNRLKEAK